MLLSLMMTFLTSCANPPVYVYVKQKIPEELLQCERIKLEGDTYADVIRLAYREKIALIECSERMNFVDNKFTCPVCGKKYIMENDIVKEIK